MEYYPNTAVGYIDNTYDRSLVQPYGDIEIRQKVSGVMTTRLLFDNSAQTADFSVPISISADTTHVINLSAASTSNSRGISFNSKVALSASQDGWLRLNQNSQFTSGVYTPLGLRADGGVDSYTGYKVLGTPVIDASRNFAGVGGSFTNNFYIAGTTYNGLSIGETATNYGGWDRQLNLNGTGNARMHVKTTAGIQMGMYAHDTWHNSGGGYLGTYTNHKVTFIINAASSGYIDTSSRLTWQHSVLIGGEWTKNSYNQVSSTSLAFGGGTDLPNYSIGTTMENVGGNYTKLNIKWHTGIRFFVLPTYGGVRFFSDAAMTNELMSIGNLDTGVRIAGLLHANGGLAQDGHPLINGSDTWYRTIGDDGLFCSTYSGGINMLDTTWVRVYNGKALYVPNQIAATGNITAYYSDERLKTKTGNIENALDKVRSLSGFNYVENDLAKELGYTNEKQQVGLSAQQVQAVLPEAVSLAPVDMETDEFSGEITSKSGENYLTVDYSRLVPLLVEAIKEQQEQIDELKLKLKEK